MAETAKHYDVIIIGAGLSGLTTAKELSDKFKESSSNNEAKILLLEANNRIGGRLEQVAIKVENGTQTFDIGGQWVGRTQKYMLDLLQSLQLETYDQYVTGCKLGQFGCKDIRPYSEGLPVGQMKHYSLLEGFDMARTLCFMESCAAKVKTPTDPFSCWNGAKDADTHSVAAVVNKMTYSRAAADALDIATRVSLGCDSHRLSHLYLTLYGRMVGSIMNLLSADENSGAQAMKVKGGAFQVCSILADRLKAAGNVEMRLNSPVVKVEHLEKNKLCKITVMNKIDGPAEQAPMPHNYHGQTLTNFTCKHAVLALAPSQCAKITFEPHLTSKKLELFNTMAMGNLIKFIITYERAFWRDKGYSGEIISTGLTESSLERKPVLVTFDACSPNASALVGFIHNEFSDMESDIRRDLVIQDLERFFGPDVYSYIDYADKSWHTEPYVGGCPVGILSTGGGESFLTIRDMVFGRVHFGGTETATEWPGYMSGAVQAGLRVAHEVLHDLQPESLNEQYLEGSQLTNDYMKPLPVDWSYKPTKCTGYFWDIGWLVAGALLGACILYKNPLRKIKLL